MKYLLTTILTFLLSANLLAIQPIHKLFPVRNADGSSVLLYKHGNGHVAYYTTPDNHVVVPNSDGILCYASVVADRLVASSMRVSEPQLRTQQEIAFLSNGALTPAQLPEDVLCDVSTDPHRSFFPARSMFLDDTEFSSAPRPRRSYTASTADGLGRYGLSSKGCVPSIGNITIPVIMVQFKDTKFQSTTTQELMTRYFNEPGFSEAAEGSFYTSKLSVREYFETQSRGLFVPSFDVVDVVSLPRNASYYGSPGNANSGDDGYRLLDFLRESIEQAVAHGVDFSKYVNPATSQIPLVSFFFAGQGEATGGTADCIWPHQAELGSAYPFSGYKFGGYFVGNELFGSSSLMGMGVFVHEFSHALGFPDWYSTNYTDESPFGMWSVLDAGCYNNDAYQPIGYTAYERSYLGWLEIPQITSAQAVTLDDPYESTGSPAVLYRNPNNAKEYFVFENYQDGVLSLRGGGSGMRVTRIYYNQDSWENNTVNAAKSKKRCMMVTADGSTLIDNSINSSVLFGNGTSDLLSLSFYNGSTSTYAPLYQIMKHSDRRISFSFKERNLYVEERNNGVGYQRVTDLSQLQPQDEVIIVNADECMAIGKVSSSSARIATTIALEGSDIAYGNDDVQTYTMVRTADGSNWGFSYRSGSKNYYLCVGSNGALSVTNKTGNTCMATIAINDGTATIRFGGSASARTIGYTTENTCFRCFDATTAPNVSIFRRVADITPISPVIADHTSAAPSTAYTLSGQRATSITKGIVIKNGKKIIR